MAERKAREGLCDGGSAEGGVEAARRRCGAEAWESAERPAAAQRTAASRSLSAAAWALWPRSATTALGWAAASWACRLWPTTSRVRPAASRLWRATSTWALGRAAARTWTAARRLRPTTFDDGRPCKVRARAAV